jgi:hypothetical protein
VFEKSYNGKLSQYIPELMDRLWGKDYDVAGILYFYWDLLIYLLLVKEFYTKAKESFSKKNKEFQRHHNLYPKVNKWEDPNKRFCVEIFGEKLSMVSPIQMVKRWMSDPTLTQLHPQD